MPSPSSIWYYEFLGNMTVVAMVKLCEKLYSQISTDTYALSDLGNFVHILIKFLDADEAVVCFHLNFLSNVVFNQRLVISLKLVMAYLSS